MVKPLSDAGLQRSKPSLEERRAQLRERIARQGGAEGDTPSSLAPASPLPSSSVATLGASAKNDLAAKRELIK
ncbi:unnamed protein product [Chrysoparadoxa australica]